MPEWTWELDKFVRKINVMKKYSARVDWLLGLRYRALLFKIQKWVPESNYQKKTKDGNPSIFQKNGARVEKLS
ncbi:MAG: hypothetical protein ACI92E_001031 [Oceanicoccus sp.]